MRHVIRLSLIFVMLALTGCNLLPIRPRVSNPPVFQPDQVAASFDHTAFGVTPLPANAKFSSENWYTENYDALLNCSVDPSCPIASSSLVHGAARIGEPGVLSRPDLCANLEAGFPEGVTSSR